MRGVSRVVLVTQPVLSQELSLIDSAERARIEHVYVRDVAAGAAEIAVSPAGHAEGQRPRGRLDGRRRL
jgi:hypothetical protein